jgi:hypothetical protein
MQSGARTMARCVAVFDLLATGCLAGPGFETRFTDALAQLDALAGFATPVASLTPLGLLLANLAGALGVLWALVRIAWPLRRLVAADAVARLGVAALIAYSIEVRGLSPVLWAFVATELLGSALQAWVFPRLRDPRDSLIRR